MDSIQRSIEQIRDIFNRAQMIPPGDARNSMIAEACSNDAALCKEVESLLEAYDTTNEFLSRDASGEALVDCPDLVGTMIDDYRLVEHIGEGGFGEVFRAKQTQPFQRDVALKIVKLGMDTQQVIARFKAERQALARMKHPGIAQIYDAGATDSGRPYFVMELVDGIPIIDYCNRHRLALPDRINLFRQVCEAVEHAHHKGILHRDLKPSNILVCEENGQPRPKIIDFGVAKSLEGRLTEQTLATLQEMLIGTPTYMSPEQLNQDTSDIDARSDIYSLGVILYELVAGTTPLEHKTTTAMTMAEMRQTLNEKDLPRPSKRYQALGNKTVHIASERQIKPPTLERLLRGDLDWVVMKAIEKERNLRYDDVMALSEDLEHYLRHETVSAGAPSRTRQLRKFIRRHKTPSVVTASIALTVFIGAGVMTYSFFHIIKEPLSFIEQRGWKLELCFQTTEFEVNDFVIRPDGSVLFSSGWTDIPRSGLFIAKTGAEPSKVTALAEGKLFEYPTGMVELPDGIFVSINNPHNGSTKILNVSPDDGTITELCGLPILNPFGMLVASDTFDGPSVDPGDLLVFDNGLGYTAKVAIWAVSRTTGKVRLLIRGNPLGEGFLNGSFGPDGMLYAGLNDRYPHTGADILRISPEGVAEVVLEKFYFSEVVNDQHENCVAVHPVTGEVFFACRNKTFAFFPGKTQPRLVLSKGRKLRWAADGSSLFISQQNALWRLSGPDIATRPVSTEP